MSAPFDGNVHKTREAWLSEGTQLLAKGLFGPAGYTVPKNVRVSCAWPSRGGLASKRRVIGQAWHFHASDDGHYEIMISPNVDDQVSVLATLAHEIVHITVGFKCGHRGPFRSCALAIGLEGRMTATKPGEAFRRSASRLMEKLGPYPHARLDPTPRKRDDPDTTGKPAQKGRMRKAQCNECGLVMRLTKIWITDKRLSCPDMNCNGHKSLLSIY